ncbi:hypothetical protein [Paraburkholderia sp. GAS206C]|uniref:hypothetical protein n=1 Tax=unclassified Paraburkholderia TaxID=2615204 RepID=UPI003D1958EA
MGETYSVWTLTLADDFDKAESLDAAGVLPRAFKRSNILHHQIYRGRQPAYYAVSKYREEESEVAPEIGGLLESHLTGAIHKAALWLDRKLDDMENPFDAKLLHIPERHIVAIWLNRKSGNSEEHRFLVASAPDASLTKRRVLLGEMDFTRLLRLLELPN